MTVRILTGDCRELLATLPERSVQTCVTSPPYHGLRAYGGDAGMIGLEPTIAAHIAALVDVFRGVWRVLRDDGTLWLNYGDRFENKQLAGLPWRIAFALQADGWYLRSAIVWHKPNPMPESVRDRPTSAYEHIFLLTKSGRYYYDADALREPNSENTHGGLEPNNHKQWAIGQNTGKTTLGTSHQGRNVRNVWTIPTAGFAEAHFAVFPPEIPRRCILAGSREGDTVLDPFTGAGTTLLVADRLGRNAIGVEVSPDYVALAERRIRSDAPLFAEVESA